MRKKLKIIFYIWSIIYFFRWLSPVKINIDDDYVHLIYWIFTLPYLIYESSQLIKDDKVNGTHVFRNRLIMMAVAGIILILSAIYMNKIHHI